MENVVFKSEYALVTFNEETQILVCTYLPETEKMLNYEWKELMLKIVSVQEVCSPKFIIDDNRYRLYAYEPEVQVWTLELFIKCWNRIRLKKYVQIIPKNIIGQLATEQIVELGIQKFEPLFEIRIVEDFNEAMEWIHN